MIRPIEFLWRQLNGPQITAVVKAKKSDVVKRVEALSNELKEAHKENEKLKAELAESKAGALIEQVEELAGLKVLVTQIDGLDMNGLKNMGDSLKDQLQNGVVVLLSHVDNKVNLVAMATNSAVSQGVHCGQIISQTAAAVGGKGGGRPNMAQAGGKDASKIAEAMNIAKTAIKGQIQG